MLNNPAVRSLLQQVVAKPVVGRHAQQLACTVGRNFHSSEPAMEIFMVNSEDDFKNKVMRSPVPVIVNFHAEWCEPCHSLKPLLEKIAQENEGHLHLAEVW
ncbi:putative thioredoxin-2 [Portunus trituberculatus]|uniref:Putative thioredoxin-2 n=2 Tax=Portunus trituberculatus TaxID=210409 RepID=A0A5B7H3X9_PORTR|nr:putative thioredoxin-2 [Portunus trituberculatus]